MIRSPHLTKWDNTYYGMITEYYKGGAPAMPPQPSPAEQAAARMDEARENARLAAEKETRDRQYQDERDAREQARKDALAAQEKAAAQEALQARRKNNTSKLQQSKENALNYGRTRLAQRGLDPASYGIMDDYNNRIERALLGFNEDAETFIDPISTSGFDDAYEVARANKRREFQNQARQFAGDGFEEQAFADTADDAIIDSILGTQQTEAQEAIDRAYARGQINDGGKSYAGSQIGIQAKKARSQANSLGMGVLTNYRDQLRGVGTKVNDRISNYDFGDDFDLSREQGRIQSTRDRLSANLEGDIYSALGDTEFFDTNTILGKAGQRSGVTNTATGVAGTPNTSNVLNAFTDRTQTNTNNTTTGNQVF